MDIYYIHHQHITAEVLVAKYISHVHTHTHTHHARHTRCLTPTWRGTTLCWLRLHKHWSVLDHTTLSYFLIAFLPPPALYTTGSASVRLFISPDALVPAILYLVWTPCLFLLIFLLVMLLISPLCLSFSHMFRFLLLMVRFMITMLRLISLCFVSCVSFLRVFRFL